MTNQQRKPANRNPLLIDAARSETRAADAKANALVTAAAVIVTAEAIAAAVNLPALPRMLLAASSLAVVIALILLLVAIRPRVSRYGQDGEDGAQIVYRIALRKYRVIQRAVDVLLTAVVFAAAALLAAYLT